MFAALLESLRNCQVAFRQDVPMKDYTTLKVGGTARFFVEASSSTDVVQSLAAARRAGAAAYIVGGGSNLLVRDGGIDGLVIRIGAGMDSIAIQGHQIRAQAGARLSQLAVAAQRAGLSGLEKLAGIPGTVGGALAMNAGAYGGEIADIIQSAQAILPSGELATYTVAEMDFGYRHSAFAANGWIATEATFGLSAKDPDVILAEMRALARKRQEAQPLTLPSAGSFFKRPVSGFAGAYIEQAGLKGLRVGGAQVSEKHAGFLVNTGGATAKDFLDLMEIIQDRVLQEFNVLLEAEVQILGCDSYS